MDNVRNLRFWNCVQGIASIPRWACDFGIASMEWRLLFFVVRDVHTAMGLCIRSRVHGTASVIFRRARRPYADGLMLTESRPWNSVQYFFLALDGHTAGLCFWNRVHGIAFIIFRRARRPYGDGLMFMELRPWNSAYYWQTGL